VPRRLSRIRRILAATLAVLTLAALVVAAVPPLRARAKAVAVLARSVGLPFPRPFARQLTVRTVRPAPGLIGDLYAPGRAPAVVLSPGAAPDGKDDPRLVRVARSLAGANRAVFVPQLDLRHQTFSQADVTRLVESVRYLQRLEGGPVGMVGISYGGSFCLLAAEDPRIAREVAFVAVFGSFDRLLDVVQGITTGATTSTGRVVRWRTVPEATAILDRAAESLAPAQDREPLRRALFSRDPTGLPADAVPIYDLLTNRDPRRTVTLATRLPPSFREALARFSPAGRLSALAAPLFVMQAENDPATPPTEAELFRRSVPHARVVILRYFEHVSPPGQGTPLLGRVGDLYGGWKFVSWVLSAQD
jgi:pimeloyl-ACP methyl ester carboxylesterase